MNVCRNAHGNERRGHQVMKTFGRERCNFGERLARNKGRRQLGGDCDRHLDGLCFNAGFDCSEGAIEPAKPVRDYGERVGHALGGFLMCLLLPGRKALPIGVRLGIDSPALMLDHSNGRLFAGSEILVEQVFGGRFHSLPFAHDLFRKLVPTFLDHARLSRSVHPRRGSWR
jgi:hypothetical protein